MPLILNGNCCIIIYRRKNNKLKKYAEILLAFCNIMNINTRKIKKKFWLITEKLKTIEKRKALMILVALGLIIGGVLIYFFISKSDSKKIYEVAIMVRDQNSSNSDEDERSSMKIGDVLVVKPDGQEWSQIEKVSYLILKMKLTDNQAQKLIQPETREIKKPEPSQEELSGLSDEQKKEFTESRKEPDYETIRPRAYRIKMDKFKDFKAIDLLNVGQPYLGKVYGWGIVGEK